MSRLNTCDESQLQDATLDALEPTRINGALAPVYLQIANSEVALQAYLQMEAALRASGLSLKEIEAIKLAVSQHNQCDYCLSVHTVKSKGAGIDKSDQLSIRRGDTLEDPRLNAIVQVTHHLLKQPGSLPKPMLDMLLRVGVDARQMVDIALAISTISFTNLFNHFNDSQSPFPAAAEL